MPDIHFTDAMLTAILTGGIGLAIFMVRAIWKLDKRTFAIEIVLRNFFDFEQLIAKSLGETDVKLASKSYERADFVRGNRRSR